MGEKSRVVNRRRVVKRATNKGPTDSTVAKARGFRSAGEMYLYDFLVGQESVRFRYEDQDLRIPYVVPATNHLYNCDFALKKKDGSIMYVEYKGRWEFKDMEKHRLVQSQHPDKDIRIIFERDPRKQVVRTGSKTTYAMICTKGQGRGKWKSLSIPFTTAVVKNKKLVLPPTWLAELAQE